MKPFELSYTQLLEAPLEKVWAFFADPGNLERITPPDLGFRVTGVNGEGRLQEGMTISYTLQPLFGVPLGWVSRITHVLKPFRFDDEQVSGPYELWQHTHLFREVPGGVEVTDRIRYLLPFGPLGSMFNELLVAGRLEAIFRYRSERLQELFRSPGDHGGGAMQA